MKKRTEAGFTIFELMVTVALVAIIAAFGVPNMRDFIKNGRLAGTANNIFRSTQIARSEAIKRHRTVVACASANPGANAPTCSYTDGRGWIVFEDTDNNWQINDDELLIHRFTYDNADSDGNALFSVIGDNDRIVSYSQFGFRNPNGARDNTENVAVVDERGILTIGQLTTARVLQVTPTGSARVTRDPAIVTQSCETVGLDQNCSST